MNFAPDLDEQDQATLDLSHLRRLWPFVAPYRGTFVACLLILGLSFVLELAGPYLLRVALDGPIADAIRGRPTDPNAVWRLGALYLAVTVGGVSLGWTYAMLTARAGQRVIRDLRVRLFGHLLRLGLGFYDRNASGKLVTRVTTDVENLNELISTGVLQSLFDLLKIVGVLAVLFWLDPTLALITLLATPIVIAVSLAFRNRVRTSYRDVRHRLALQNAFAGEAIGGVRVARMFGREPAVAQQFAARNRQTRNAWLATAAHFAAFVALVDVALRTTQVAILGVGGHGVISGAISAGVFVQFWLYFHKLSEPIRELGEKYNVLQSAFASSERIFGILDEPVAPIPAAQPQPAGQGPAALRFEQVEFAYRDGPPVLHGIDFEVPPGQRTALVGPTGAGKSTVLALVSRLYDPSAGRVLLDGEPLPSLDLDGLRRRIAVVPQDVFLFTGTILDNVRLFDDAIDEARVQRALELVGARDFVQALPGGLHAPVEERGATLSHGQRQLLSFARAIAVEPDLLVLDEATANIDSESEALIQDGMRRILAGRTSLVVAHRLSTVRDADQILVVHDGRIAERGSHRELLALEGIYARMVRG
ncbi:MAG: ABC transporter ATP-binding protein [Planctomycetota bacterium]